MKKIFAGLLAIACLMLSMAAFAHAQDKDSAHISFKLMVQPWIDISIPGAPQTIDVEAIGMSPTGAPAHTGEICVPFNVLHNAPVILTAVLTPPQHPNTTDPTKFTWGYEFAFDPAVGNPDGGVIAPDGQSMTYPGPLGDGQSAAQVCINVSIVGVPERICAGEYRDGLLVICAEQHGWCEGVDPSRP